MISAEEIRKSMRISHDELDGEIARNIEVCKLDMERAGVDYKKDTALTDKAYELYCKWQYDYDGKSEQYQKAYEELRNAMSLCDKYAENENEE